jgi:ornithine decarboxylase
MNRLRARSAVSPLHGRFVVASSDVLPPVNDLVAFERPEEPMHCLRPAAVTAATQAFVEAFPGDVMYAVKCNPEPVILRSVRAGGVDHFDCASIGEVRLVRQMFADASIHFMHPVKARGAIREAWAMHGVRDFVLSTHHELTKILDEIRATEAAGELGLIVRLALPKGGRARSVGQVWRLDRRCGRPSAPGSAVYRTTRTVVHVGSQCLGPLAWRRALALAGEVIRAAVVSVDVIDVSSRPWLQGHPPRLLPGGEARTRP